MSQTSPVSRDGPPPRNAEIETAAADWVTRVDAGLTKEEQQIFQDWLAEPSQLATSSRVPSAVAAPAVARHSVLSAELTMLPSAFTVHCWAAEPVQLSMTTPVPAAGVAVVPACMHMSP